MTDEFDENETQEHLYAMGDERMLSFGVLPNVRLRATGTVLGVNVDTSSSLLSMNARPRVRIMWSRCTSASLSRSKV